MPAAKFKQMVQRADKKKIWSYADIPLWSIPYILLTLENFKHPSPDPKKEYDFHFVLEKPQDGEHSSISERLEKTLLKKVFSRNGIPVSTSDNPYPFSEDAMIKKAGDTDWIPANLLKKLFDCADN